jgi:maltose-binding protein MalE
MNAKTGASRGRFGHSRPTRQPGIKFGVRCAPKATDSRFMAICRYGPIVGDSTCLPLTSPCHFCSRLPSSHRHHLFAQLNVITSVGFEAAYNGLVPVFQKSSGITVSTKHFASQGSGPDTIAAQLRAGAAADIVIMSKEGLGELLAEGRIIPANAVDLAQVQLGVAVRAGAPKPDISTVDAFRQMLLRSIV